MAAPLRSLNLKMASQWAGAVLQETGGEKEGSLESLNRDSLGRQAEGQLALHDLECNNEI